MCDAIICSGDSSANQELLRPRKRRLRHQDGDDAVDALPIWHDTFITSPSSASTSSSVRTSAPNDRRKPSGAKAARRTNRIRYTSGLETTDSTKARPQRCACRPGSRSVLINTRLDLRAYFANQVVPSPRGSGRSPDECSRPLAHGLRRDCIVNACDGLPPRLTSSYVN